MSGSSSVHVQGVRDVQDLLRNRNVNNALGPFDGKAAALAHLAGEHYFITTNVDYVPALPSLQLPHALFLRSDMRYGTDDPTLWPQQWTSEYYHLPAIPKRGARPELDIMWWDPTPADFVVGSAVMRGVGKLDCRRMSRFLPPLNALVAKCQALQRTSQLPPSRLFGELINNVLLWAEQLQTLPTTYTKMVFAVTSLQRACLELEALYDYITIYKARVDNYFSAASLDIPVAQCVGAFTSNPTVAQQLWAAHLPFWLLRPTFLFDAENILSAVELQQPSFAVPDERAPGTPETVYSGNQTSAKMATIYRAAINNPWYRDPFATQTRPRSVSPPAMTQPTAVTPVASSSASKQTPSAQTLPANKKSL
ncbi:hypothetical protein B0H12DRAFT_1246461 [Mycena haematopus]|nr:hypothetical protein B0H12DRAFT_1246461 [Mycena haematopus]